ncbi:putative sporulation protein YtxC [Bacillus tuaregi]|uniref:putative sporulation protein YtxC n=1 Tax=Bacillus tuaregi TaxID=1816695 RepID=UPI0008F87F28|nr:putative sporulation protein YtxC [Bacillus tuaregi]
MIEIHFQHKEDAMRLYGYFQQLLDYESFSKYTLHYEDSHIVQCRYLEDTCCLEDHNAFLQWVKKSLCQFMLTVKLNDWLRHMLATHYHYRDEEEQQQIIEIVHSVLEGKMEELTVFLPKMNIKDYLSSLIHDWFQEHAGIFAFDSFVTFRLRNFHNELKKYVELSLDEYKLEQEYQMFIQTLRDFLVDREPKLKHLHVLVSDAITFFNEQFEEIKRAELAKMVDRRLLINHPVYIDSVTIAPLLSIAPAQIYIYTDDPDQPIVRTIRNIFEERIISRPLKSIGEYWRQSGDAFDKKV